MKSFRYIRKEVSLSFPINNPKNYKSLIISDRGINTVHTATGSQGTENLTFHLLRTRFSRYLASDNLGDIDCRFSGDMGSDYPVTIIKPINLLWCRCADGVVKFFVQVGIGLKMSIIAKIWCRTLMTMNGI